MTGAGTAGGDEAHDTGAEIVVDVRGSRCPVPVIALARTAWSHPAGTVIVLVADDPAAASDVAAWCRLRGGVLLDVSDVADAAGGGRRYRVRGPGPRTGGPGSAAASSSR